MNNNDDFIKRVASQTHVSKNDILKLANDLQTKDLSNENDIKDFITTVSKLTNKSLSPQKMNTLVEMIKNNKVPHDLNKMMK